MKDSQVISTPFYEWKLMRLLIWPSVMSGSMAIYWYLTEAREYEYELALQIHFLILFMSILVIEFILPYHRSWNRYDRQGLNDFIYNITFPIAQIGATLFAAWIVGQNNHGTSENLFGLDIPIIIQFIVLVLLVDLSWYICHRAFHTFPIFWKIHALHHNSEQLHVINNARLHPLEVLAFFLPIMLIVQFIDVPSSLLNAYLAFQLTVGLLTHSNIGVNSGWFSLIFNTPELHHWHHSKIRKEHDNNYGSVTMIWDHIFGSYFNPSDRQASKDIGANVNMPVSWFGQLTIPFRRDIFKDQ